MRKLKIHKSNRPLYNWHPKVLRESKMSRWARGNKCGAYIWYKGTVLDTWEGVTCKNCLRMKKK